MSCSGSFSFTKWLNVLIITYFLRRHPFFIHSYLHLTLWNVCKMFACIIVAISSHSLVSLSFFSLSLLKALKKKIKNFWAWFKVKKNVKLSNFITRKNSWINFCNGLHLNRNEKKTKESVSLIWNKMFFFHVLAASEYHDAIITMCTVFVFIEL